MKILSAPTKFQHTDVVNEKVKKHFRVKEVITFVKGHFGADVKAVKFHHGDNKVHLYLHSMKQEPVVIGMPKADAKPAAPKVKTAKKK